MAQLGRRLVCRSYPSSPTEVTLLAKGADDDGRSVGRERLAWTVATVAAETTTGVAAAAVSNRHFEAAGGDSMDAGTLREQRRLDRDGTHFEGTACGTRGRDECHGMGLSGTGLDKEGSKNE